MQSDSGESEKEARKERAKKRFIRWQEITRTHLGNVNNLLTGLGAGVVAFELQTIFRENLCLAEIERWILLGSLILLFLSMALGSWIAWNRLVDFRKTTRVDRLKWKEQEKTAEIGQLQQEARRLGDRTWCMLRWQTGLFGLGMFLLVISAGRRLWGCPLRFIRECLIEIPQSGAKALAKKRLSFL